MQSYPAYPSPDPYAGGGLPPVHDPYAQGWHQSVPEMQAFHLQPPAAAPPAPTSRVRWGRIVLAFLGAAMLAFAASNMIKASSGSPRDVGRSSGDAGIASDAGDDSTATAADDGAAGLGDAGADAAGAADAPPVPDAAPPAGAAPNVTRGGGHGAHRNRSRATRARAARRKRARQARRAAAVAAGRSAHARAAAGARGGGSAAAAGSSALPHTGASIWIAAILGTLLLGFGVLMQVHAVRIAATAVLYRRGPALRPSWYLGHAFPAIARSCAAYGPQLAAALAPLARLVQQPQRESDYVSARRTRTQRPG